jgi:hypothetical protein
MKDSGFSAAKIVALIREIKKGFIYGIREHDVILFQLEQTRFILSAKAFSHDVGLLLFAGTDQNVVSAFLVG